MISARNPGWRASIVHGLIIGAYPLKAGNNQVILTSEMYGAKAGLRPWFNVRIGRTSCVFQPVRDTAKSDKGASIKSLEG